MYEIVKNIQVPTGNICVMRGDYGDIEFLSIGDYGRDANIKADFLGITRELNGVPNGDIMPLSEKWVITISTQYGCSMGCKFCDVPKVGKGRNASYNDLKFQVLNALRLHPEVGHTKRLNVHYARMGEPTFNQNVLSNALDLYSITCTDIDDSLIHPVVSTMMPKMNLGLERFLGDWCYLKNIVYNGNAGLQLSINSTDDEQREEMFSGSSLSLKKIASIAEKLATPQGRKYALNFALADNYIIDSKYLASLFDPSRFMVKITPLHKTASCDENGMSTTGGYDSFTPYKQIEEELKSAGFDVIVFVPSYDEDNGLITCGNAILSGKIPSVKHTILLQK